MLDKMPIPTSALNSVSLSNRMGCWAKNQVQALKWLRNLPTILLHLDSENHPSPKLGSLSPDIEIPLSALFLGFCVIMRSQEDTTLRVDLTGGHRHSPFISHDSVALARRQNQEFGLKTVSGIESPDRMVMAGMGAPGFRHRSQHYPSPWFWECLVCRKGLTGHVTLRATGSLLLALALGFCQL